MPLNERASSRLSCVRAARPLPMERHSRGYRPKLWMKSWNAEERPLHALSVSHPQSH